MGRCKWEDLPEDCLANVFRRASVQSLLMDVPSVCKSCFRASLHPFCWKLLDFNNIVFVLKDILFHVIFDDEGVRMVHILVVEYRIKEFFGRLYDQITYQS